MCADILVMLGDLPSQGTILPCAHAEVAHTMCREQVCGSLTSGRAQSLAPAALEAGAGHRSAAGACAASGRGLPLLTSQTVCRSTSATELP